MLSNSKGYSTRFQVQGFRKDSQTAQSILCPTLLRKGRCRSYDQERAIRAQIAKEKEEELRKKAKAMYALQTDLLADMEADLKQKLNDGSGEAEDAELEKMQQVLFGSVDGRGRAVKASKAEVIERLVQELKQEPDYIHWSLDGDVAERMVQQKVRPCKYSHRIEALRSIKRARNISTVEANVLAEKEREELEGEKAAPSSLPSTSPPPKKQQRVEGGEHHVRRLAAFAEERARVFASFTPLQRCVVALLWQRTFRVPQQLVCADIRRLVEHAVEEELLAKSATGDVEEELDAFLDSAEFEARVKVAESAIVERTVFVPAFGVLNLSFLPQLVAYFSKYLYSRQGNRKAVGSEPSLTEATLQYFGSSHAQLFSIAKSTGNTKATQVLLTEKELDLSVPARAAELVEAVEWAIHLYNTERRLRSSFCDVAEKQGSASGEAADLSHMRLSYRAGRVVLRSLSLHNCQMTLADGLVAALHKSGLDATLLALDLSNNRLHSLRFLFALRAHFAERLLRLSLKNNLITRKPEYQEQVRKSLPRLTSLDGEPIRRPPLRFPKAQSASYTAFSLAPGWANDSGDRHRLSQCEYDTVMDGVARLFYIWETKRVPLTELEIKAYLREAREDSEDSNGRTRQRRECVGRGESKADDVSSREVEEDTEAVLPMEEEVNEDNFPHRYLHPSATFTFTASPGTVFFDPDTMKLDRQVELDDDFTGVRLNAHDIRDARVFDVSMRNSSRNLLAGRPALQRYGRGSDNCYLAYQYSVYPERLEVDHGLGGATVSITKVPLPTNDDAAAPAKKGFGTGPVGGSDGRKKPRAKDRCLYVVNLHGVMTWRLPSMRHTQCFSAAYDRTMVLTEKLLAVQNFAWERRRSPRLVLCNDHLLLRPLDTVDGSRDGASSTGMRAPAVFSHATAARLARLIVQFGLEACKDAEAFVKCVMERTTSDAAEEAALDALVFGPQPTNHVRGKEEEGEGHEAVDSVEAAADAAVRAVFAAHLSNESGKPKKAKRHCKEAAREEGDKPHTPSRETVYHIFSLLDRDAANGTAADGMAAHSSGIDSRQTTPAHNAPATAWGGSKLHEVPLRLLVAVTRTLNDHYAVEAFMRSRLQEPPMSVE